MDPHEEILCDYCEAAKVKLVCQDCYQGMWCSEKCHLADAADHDEYFCYHPDDLSDECVLEEVEHATHDPQEAREMMKEMIGDDLIEAYSGTGGTTRRRRRALKYQRRQARKRRRQMRRERMKLRKEKRKLAAERRERRRLNRARKAEGREAKRLDRERERLRAAQEKTLKQAGIEPRPEGPVEPPVDDVLDDTASSESLEAYIASFVC